MTNATAATITLEIHRCDTGRSFRATWTGPAAETNAVAWLTARGDTHAYHEIEAEPINFGSYDNPIFPTLYDLLYPTCDHGMTGDCYGPQHYYYDEEEQARGLRNGW